MGKWHLAGVGLGRVDDRAMLDRNLVGVEVKASATLGTDDLRGLKALAAARKHRILTCSHRA